MTTATRADVVEEARSYMSGKGTRWLHQGRLKHVGVDCIGLLGMSALALGVSGAQEWRDAREYHNYGPHPRPHLIYGGCERFLDQIPIADAAAGDVLVLAFRTMPMHFALISRVAPMYLIHAYTSIGRVVENGVPMSGARIVRAYRFRGVAA